MHAVVVQTLIKSLLKPAGLGNNADNYRVLLRDDLFPSGLSYVQYLQGYTLLAL